MNETPSGIAPSRLVRFCDPCGTFVADASYAPDAILSTRLSSPLCPPWRTTWDASSVNFEPMAAIRKGAKPHLYIREWIEHRDISVIQLAGRLGVDRSAVYKWLSGDRRLETGTVAHIAEALGCLPQDLWRPPSRPSLDALLADQPDSMVSKAAEMIEILKRAG
jgi:DNA-binding Xre family transcriptional regulator